MQRRKMSSDLYGRFAFSCGSPQFFRRTSAATFIQKARNQMIGRYILGIQASYFYWTVGAAKPSDMKRSISRHATESVLIAITTTIGQQCGTCLGDREAYFNSATLTSSYFFQRFVALKSTSSTPFRLIDHLSQACCHEGKSSDASATFRHIAAATFDIIWTCTWCLHTCA